MLSRPRGLRLVTTLLLALGALTFVGCETTGGATSSGPGNPRLPEPASAAVLRAGDSLGISLQGIPDPSMHNVQIDEQGLISLPYIGGVSAAGLTAADLSVRIRADYINRDFYRAIDVSVTVTERFVYVGGEVQRPGRIVWTPDLTMTKAIQAAGGFTLYAKETAVNVVRDQSSYSLDARLARRSPAEDPRLFPGDSIQVDRSAF
ncbi:polysaccharide biosynthesis/export family protein [Actomonas aquatica]|uniref:Polysaccharide biosynthesis/export family protein n=1 Tax=Actomonas aquatica TaxID=2866162 RepID=A0ABZ1C746_9BACT|nr:polysaccharide biosynthesis/export family protein [Opitutus sp. WL0086]WRQ87536.1 polysaccharide biosynthesis/export family protein [Opitutus sp. WL0086]